MAQIVKLRRSAVTGNKPTTSQLELGELAMNTYDGKIYFEKSGSTGESIEEILITNAQNTGSLSISGSSHNISGALTLSGSVKLPSTVRDYTNSTGSVGQILQVTENGAVWVDNTATNTGDGRTSKQTFASATTWSFNHNLSEQYPVIELYDNNNQVIIPSSITAATANNLIITFAVPVAGKAVATVGGMMGPQGPVGAQGANGFVGSDGAQGAQGIQGAKGDQGFQGFQGFQGYQGNQGYQGAQGDQGYQGIQGAQGDQGYQGTQGDQGFQGFQGTQGDQGYQGIQGSTGAQGAKGDQGFQGIKGDQGFQGFQGDQGATGAQGAVSSSARNVNIFSATNGQTTFTVPGGYTVGLVDVFWNGVKQTEGVDYTASNGTTVVLTNAAGTGDTIEIDNYLGEIGSQGNQGATGAQGTVGPQGATGNQGATGSQGPTGSQGSVGAQGAKGDQGDIGAQGATGSQGATGLQGSVGPTGLQGSTGDQGSIGAQGVTGAQGTTGAQGVQGATGAQGNQGTQGPGVSGTQGYVAKFTSGSAIGNSQIFDDGTNIGVGITLPVRKLHVAGQAAFDMTGTGVVIQSDGVSSQIVSYKQTGATYSDLHLRGAALGIVIKGTSGDVGIGTSTLASGRRLTVAGGAQFTYGDNSGASFNIIPGVNGQDGADFNLSYYTGTGYGPLTFTLGGGEKIRIANNGYLGLLNNDPQARLHIGAALANSADATNGLILKQTSTNETTGIYLERSGERRGYAIYVGGSLDSLNFQRNNAGTKSDTLTLTRDGHVGINQQNPTGLGGPTFVVAGSGYPEVIVEKTGSNARKWGFTVGSDGSYLLRDYTSGTNVFTVNTSGASSFIGSITTTGASVGRVVMDYDGTDSWFRMQSGNRMRITTTGGTDFIIPNTGNMTYNGQTVWHSGNDGSGSGLDADLLDGRDSGGYMTQLQGSISFQQGSYTGWYKIARSSQATNGAGLRGGFKVIVAATGNYLDPTQDEITGFKNWTTTAVITSVVGGNSSIFQNYRITYDADYSYLEGYISYYFGGDQDIYVTSLVHGLNGLTWSPMTGLVQASTTSNGAVSIGKVGTGLAVPNLRTAGGIQFGNGTSTLNYYEEGTFTPTSVGTNMSSVTPIFGRYVRIGNQVSIQVRWEVTPGGTGQKYIVFNLPFAFYNSSNVGYTGAVSNYNNGLSSSSSNVGTSVRNSSGSDTQQYVEAVFTSTNTGAMFFAMTYFTF